jgi:hypothetical protein
LHKSILKQTITHYKKLLAEADDEEAREGLRVLIEEAERELAATQSIWKITCAHLPWAPAVCEQLETCLQHAVWDAKADFGTLQLWDEENRDLRLVAHQNFGRDFLDHFRVVRADDGSVCAQALAERQPVTVEDVETNADVAPQRAVMRQAGVRAIQSMPILAPKGDLVGMISFHFNRPQEDMEVPVIRFWANNAGRMIAGIRRDRRTEL